MNKTKSISLAVAMFAIVGMMGFNSQALAGTGNGAPSGPHYNLNLIGVPKDKTADMTGNNGHRIFVPLYGNCKINLMKGPDATTFDVLDGNCTDGNSLFELPDPSLQDDGTVAYQVWVRALGKPGGTSTTTTCMTDGVDTYCSTENIVLLRTTGKSEFQNVSKQLLTLCIDNGDGTCTRTGLFDDDAFSYYWDYDNTGLKIAQLRFYPVSTNINTCCNN